MPELRVENGTLEVLNSRFPNVRGVQARSAKRTLATCVGSAPKQLTRVGNLRSAFTTEAT